MITTIRLVNCQSLKDITLELATDRLNVLVAENNTGKSVFYKMLKVTASPDYFSREETKELIRIGADFAMIMFQFDDDCIGATIITHKQVIYKFRHPEDDDFIASLNPPPELLDHLGLITNKEDFVANIIDTDQDMLLVNSDLKSNGQLIKFIAENSTLSEIEVKCTRLIDEFKKYGSDVTTYVTGIQSQLNQLEFTDVLQLERQVETQKLCCKSCEEFVKIYNCLHHLQMVARDKVNYDSLLKLVDALSKIEGNLSKVKIEKDIDESLLTLVEKLIVLRQSAARISVSSPCNFELLSPLEKFKALSIKLNSVIILSDVTESICIIADKGVQIEKVKTLLERVQNTLNQFNTEKMYVDKLQEELEGLGEVVDCPIYGKVVYDGKECISCSD